MALRPVLAPKSEHLRGNFSQQLCTLHWPRLLSSDHSSRPGPRVGRLLLQGTVSDDVHTSLKVLQKQQLPWHPFSYTQFNDFFSQVTELTKPCHSPMLGHCHLPNKFPHVCLQLISIPTSSPDEEHVRWVPLPSLTSHILSFSASIPCIEWLPICFLVRDNACAISYFVQVGHKCTCARMREHTHTTITTTTNNNLPHPAHQGVVHPWGTMLPIQLLHVWPRFSKVAGKSNIILHNRYHF